MSNLRYAALSDTGRVRDHNEDAWFAKPELGLFGVSDGMGGHAAGDWASRIVVETLPSMLAEVLDGVTDLADKSLTKKVLAVFTEISQQMRQESKNKPGLDRMGATVVTAIVRGQQALVIHMGDSRAYLCRGQEMELLTKDHSIVQSLVEAGALTPEQALNHPARAQISRYVGMDGDALPEAQSCLELQPGDRLLLCTDGLTGMVDAGCVADIVSGHADLDDACHSLIDAANEAGGQDNITALLISVDENSNGG